MEGKSLFEKYDRPVPRYTSYPTVPFWSETPTRQQWIESLRRGLSESAYSIYIHLPFCETLCTYCGCNTVITKDHAREAPYVDQLIKEWSLYQKNAPELKTQECVQIHLGGGTPTFFSTNELKRLLVNILESSKLATEFEGSIEVDPRTCTEDQLVMLRELGFKRISLGVQDFNEEVQRAVNRIQPPEITKNLTDLARKLGYRSVNFDLIYGLPFQTLERMKRTVELTLTMKPDRIALYSLAKVPWIKKAHRIFKDEDLPLPDEKRALYEYSRLALEAAGYVEIGMDHFALKSDALFKALQDKELHRSFMGYTEKASGVLVSLGVSAISETRDCFHQNEKVLPKYIQALESDEIPTLRGHLLSNEDQRQRRLILDLMTQYEVTIESSEEVQQIQEFLSGPFSDGLAQFDGNRLIVTEKGRPFLRIICTALDKRLHGGQPDPEKPMFSKAI